MDNFIDKLAQRFGSQEIIRANAEAEEKENKRLKEQLDQYDARLQEIRKLNLKNLEIADRLEKVSEQGDASNKKILEETHNECVRVFRNVQAVVDGGFNSQQDYIEEEFVRVNKKVSGLKALAIMTFLLSLGNVALVVLQLLGVL